jgi:Pyruvate/2-oxoacid:ferredoxin oxidoreductase delta subunit
MNKGWANIGAMLITLGFVIFVSALWKGPVHWDQNGQDRIFPNNFALLEALQDERDQAYTETFLLPRDVDRIIEGLDVNSYRIPGPEDGWTEKQLDLLIQYTSWMAKHRFRSEDALRKALLKKLKQINSRELRLYENETKIFLKETGLSSARNDGRSLRNMLWTSLILILLGCSLYSFIPHLTKGKGVHNDGIFESPIRKNALGIILGAMIMGFYIMLYWYPEFIAPWIVMVDPISLMINGNLATEWFFYGWLYTMVMLVMGIRMYLKYQGDRYQSLRTTSILFFQICFAFIIPEIMVRLNRPYQDLKNIWPLDYELFFTWNLRTLIDSGQFGFFLLLWGIALALVAVPVLVYFFGKRWYCSWVCGCGGLAETLGDPFRQRSSKTLRSWKIERWSVHSVLVVVVLMTMLSLLSFTIDRERILGMHIGTIQQWYGFLIGSVFAGVIGAGFYPIMGNRVWCRFGCPLAAYLGLVQRFKSRFRVSTNGGQCISCGNCTTYCEMGIDVRMYAQRGQDIVRSSCVGCGICASVCPRGVLKLENGDAGDRWVWSEYSVGNEGLRMDGKK